MLCPVCGGTLAAQVSGCSSCPMNSGCDMLCCENCGYETVAPRSVVVDFFRRVFGRSPRHKHTVVSRSPTPSHD
jgi:hypothetical protein